MALDGASELVHATAIALRTGGKWRAAIVRGASGAGKSDLALRCLATPPSALLRTDVALVADDQVRIVRGGTSLRVSCPPALRGKLEVRGIGIIEISSVDDAELALVVDLAPRPDVPRFPDPPPRCMIMGIAVPRLVVSAFEASAHMKLLIALIDPAVLGGSRSA